MKTKDILLVFLVATTLTFAGLYFTAPTPVFNPGASAGPEHTNQQQFRVPSINGGVVTTMAVGATSAPTAFDFCNSSVIAFAPTVASATTTTPDASDITARCLPHNGDSVSFKFRNTATTGASSTLIVGGTGIVLLEPDGQNVIIGGGASAIINMWRVSSAAEVLMSVDELIDAD